MPRSRTYPDDLRDRLVAAALDRLRDHVPDEVSLRDLAAECDTSTNAIYSIFGGKDELVASVAALARRELGQQLTALPEDGLDLAALFAAGHRYRAWARRQPMLYRLLFSRPQTPGGPTGISAGDLASFVGLLRQMMEAGVLRVDDPVTVLTTLWVSLHGFTLLELDVWPGGGPEADRYFAALQVHLAAGLAVPNPAGSVPA